MTRQWPFVMVALVAGLLGGVLGSRFSAVRLASAAESPQKVIAAQRILLVDGKGITRGALRISKEGEPSLAFYDQAGKLRCDLAVGSDDEPWGLKFFDSSGTMRISITISPDGDIPALRLYDAQARPRTLLGVDPEGEPALDFYTQQGRLMRELP